MKVNFMRCDRCREEINRTEVHITQQPETFTIVRNKRYGGVISGGTRHYHVACAQEVAPEHLKFRFDRHK